MQAAAVAPDQPVDDLALGTAARVEPRAVEPLDLERAEQRFAAYIGPAVIIPRAKRKLQGSLSLDLTPDIPMSGRCGIRPLRPLL